MGPPRSSASDHTEVRVAVQALPSEAATGHQQIGGLPPQNTEIETDGDSDASEHSHTEDPVEAIKETHAYRNKWTLRLYKSKGLTKAKLDEFHHSLDTIMANV